MRVERRVGGILGRGGSVDAEVVVHEHRKRARLADAALDLADRVLGRPGGAGRQQREVDVAAGLVDLVAIRVGDLRREALRPVRGEVDAVRLERLDRVVDRRLGERGRRAHEQRGDADQEGAHSSRSRSRSSVSFCSSRGWMTGTSMRAVSPLGLASTDCVSRVPPPAATSA